LFGVAFGFVEASVVSYLRELLHFNVSYIEGGYKTLLNVGFITFIMPDATILRTAHLTLTETVRELSTIVMLAAISYLSAKKLRQRIGAFMVSFAVWDLFYYVFLKFLTGWPNSLWDIDVYFLIPVPWAGPVLTPIVISLLLLFFGSTLYLKNKEK
jgi:hypothetical protein